MQSKITVKICACFALLYAGFSDAGLSQHLKKDHSVEKQKKQIEHIDCIYVLNLDRRPEKWAKCIEKLKVYDIIPRRFSGIYGWDLSLETKEDLGVVFTPGMMMHRWIGYFPKEKKGALEVDFLSENFYGKTVFAPWMTPGAIGCYLSHLSILQDAYDAGYETIWVMEDDIKIEKDPHILATYIEKLDLAVGENGWDVLYTDTDTANTNLYTEPNDFISDLKGDLTFFWRPDRDLSGREVFARRKIVNDDFLRIGSRMRTHSMIIRRSGMKKILEYIKTHRLFLPYDHELAIVPGISLFNLRKDVVTFEETTSDTRSEELSTKIAWEECRKSILEEVPKIAGWYNLDRSYKLLEFLYEKKPNLCVEIGAYGGSTTYQIAKTLSFLQKGKLYAIDSWNKQDALEGVEKEKERNWWQNLDFAQIKNLCFGLIASKGLEPFCQLIEKHSKEAVSLFADGSIDFLYLDGNSSGKGVLEDVLAYFPKVKSGGYICLRNEDAVEKNTAIAYLMKNCVWLREYSSGIDNLIFQKK